MMNFIDAIVRPKRPTPAPASRGSGPPSTNRRERARHDRRPPSAAAARSVAAPRPARGAARRAAPDMAHRATPARTAARRHRIAPEPAQPSAAHRSDNRMPARMERRQRSSECAEEARQPALRRLNVKLKGVEISDCDLLVVEGHVEATAHSKAMEIAKPGTLQGTASRRRGDSRRFYRRAHRAYAPRRPRHRPGVRNDSLRPAGRRRGRRDHRRREGAGAAELRHTARGAPRRGASEPRTATTTHLASTVASIRLERHAAHLLVVLRFGRERDLGAVRREHAAALSAARVALVLARPHFRMFAAERIDLLGVFDGRLHGGPRPCPRRTRRSRRAETTSAGVGVVSRQRAPIRRGAPCGGAGSGRGRRVTAGAVAARRAGGRGRGRLARRRANP